MRYEWDERKRRANLREHGLDFSDARKVFEHRPALIRADTSEDYGEERWQLLGLLHFLPVVIAFSEPEPNVRRIVSFRKAVQHERKILEEALRD